MPLGGAFTVLLLVLINGVSAGTVPPPTNVTLSCRNFSVVVSWEYSEQRPQTRFRVTVGGSAGFDVVETSERRFDLSPFVWASEERYLGFHSAAVTAVQDGNESEEVKSETFTFNDLKTAHIKCELSFPPVDVNESQSGATVTFMNPLHFYRELKQADKPSDGGFSFTVSSDAGDSDSFCTARQKTCKHDVPFPEEVEQCVTLKGRLFATDGVGQVAFRKTGRICALEAAAEASVLMWVIPLLLLIIIISVITAAVCKVKAWTMKAPSPPKPLTSKLKPHREGELRYAVVNAGDISTVRLTDRKPSLSSEEEEDEDLQGDRSAPAAVVYVEEGLAEGYRAEDDSADDSGRTVSIDLDEEEEEEEEVSPYDQPHVLPHVLQVDMGDGDMATGYTESLENANVSAPLDLHLK